MKVKLLRKIRRNTRVARTHDGLYQVKIVSGWFWHGATSVPIRKDQLHECVRELTILVAGLCFNRTDVLWCPDSYLFGRI